MAARGAQRQGVPHPSWRQRLLAGAARPQLSRAPLSGTPGQKQSVSDGYNPRFGRSRQLPGRTSAPASFLQGAAPVLGERRQLNPVRRRSITGATARCGTRTPSSPVLPSIDDLPPHPPTTTSQFYRRASERRPSQLGCVRACVHTPHDACAPPQESNTDGHLLLTLQLGSLLVGTRSGAVTSWDAASGDAQWRTKPLHDGCAHR
jgi:hypothetical protein